MKTRPDDSKFGVTANPQTCAYFIKHFSHSICPSPASDDELRLASLVATEQGIALAAAAGQLVLI